MNISAIYIIKKDFNPNNDLKDSRTLYNTFNPNNNFGYFTKKYYFQLIDFIAGNLSIVTKKNKFNIYKISIGNNKYYFNIFTDTYDLSYCLVTKNIYSILTTYLLIKNIQKDFLSVNKYWYIIYKPENNIWNLYSIGEYEKIFIELKEESFNSNLNFDLDFYFYDQDEIIFEKISGLKNLISQSIKLNTISKKIYFNKNFFFGF